MADWLAENAWVWGTWLTKPFPEDISRGRGTNHLTSPTTHPTSFWLTVAAESLLPGLAYSELPGSTLPKQGRLWALGGTWAAGTAAGKGLRK